MPTSELTRDIFIFLTLVFFTICRIYGKRRANASCTTRLEQHGCIDGLITIARNFENLLPFWKMQEGEGY